MATGYYSRSFYGDPFRVSSVSFKVDPPVKTPPKVAVTEPAFKRGDKVNVKVDTSATVEFVYPDGRLELNVTGGGELDGVASKYVTLQDPENWPPKVGQVWKAGGKNYGVRKHAYRTSAVVVFPIGTVDASYSDGFSSSLDRTLDDFKKLRPTLIG